MVVNDYHKKGVNHAMYLEMYNDAKKTGIKALEASCVDETNYESRLSVENPAVSCIAFTVHTAIIFNLLRRGFYQNYT